MSTKNLQILGDLGAKVYVQNNEPADAIDGSVWVDLDQEHILSNIDLSNFQSGQWTETVDGEVVQHTVEFDENGRPIKIDDVTIVWGAI